MKYTRLSEPYIIELENVELVDIYKTDEGKKNYYGILKCNNNQEKIQNMNLYLQRRKPRYGVLEYVGKDSRMRIKFPTHYGRPKYRAYGKDGMPTVAEVLQIDQMVDVRLKVEGYVQEGDMLHVTVQCMELYVKENCVNIEGKIN